tara:strand:- start:2060 stop:2821 length:762 start_codon:yes stop_codon:yes gene_type:complete
MLLKNTVFCTKEWRWTKYLKYLLSVSKEYKLIQKEISPNFSYLESLYGSKKNKKIVNLFNWAATSERISFSRALCINSPNYAVLNFLIIPNAIYNMPFLGLDFVSLPGYHLLVLDFQPSIQLEKQFSKECLDKLLQIKNNFHKEFPSQQKMSEDFARFFSPGLIWMKLPKQGESECLISNQLFDVFQKYLNLYFDILYKSKKVNENLQSENIKGQKFYLNFRKEKDPARPMLNKLFGSDFTESLLNDFLFKFN